MQQVDLYCKKCKKSMKMSYMVSGDKDAPVLTGITIRCHTNKSHFHAGSTEIVIPSHSIDASSLFVMIRHLDSGIKL